MSWASSFLVLRREFNITEHEFFDGMTYWQSEEYARAISKWFQMESHPDRPSDEPSIEDVIATGIPLRR